MYIIQIFGQFELQKKIYLLKYGAQHGTHRFMGLCGEVKSVGASSCVTGSSWGGPSGLLLRKCGEEWS